MEFPTVPEAAMLSMLVASSATRLIPFPIPPRSSPSFREAGRSMNHERGRVMKRWACLVTVPMLVWVVAASSQDPSGPKVSRPITKTPTTAELRKILEEVIELPDEFKQPVPFKLVLKYMVDKIAMKGGEFPFYIEVDTANGDLFDENVYFPPLLGK